jgi:proteasome lid subunit RPN8/RPN11
MAVRISRTLLNAILADAALGRGLERCGLLLGSPDHIREVRFGANVAPDPARHFELDPSVLLAAHKEARAGGAQIVGHYHSHPSGRAIPSATDARCALADGALWLLVAGDDAALWRAEEGGAVHGCFHAEPMGIYGDVELA